MLPAMMESVFMFNAVTLSLPTGLDGKAGKRRTLAPLSVEFLVLFQHILNAVSTEVVLVCDVTDGDLSRDRMVSMEEAEIDGLVTLDNL